nr:hypothetical protein [Tanacetum cinerariifolium]
MAGVDINTLTIEQYLALSRINQTPGVVKPEIRGNVNFEIKSQFMRELRKDTFSENKNEDAHDHVDRILNIVSLFNILEVTQDAVLLRVFPFTLTGTAKRWVDRLTLAAVNTWDLLSSEQIGNLKLLCNFVEKFLGTVHFENDQFAPILVGQFCDVDLGVAFRKSTCFVRDLHGNDLLTGNRGSDLYTISLQESTSSTPFCLMAKATPTQAWLWHRRLSHINFEYINLLSKKDIVIGLPKLKYVKDQLCSSCEISKAKGGVQESCGGKEIVPELDSLINGASMSISSNGNADELVALVSKLDNLGYNMKKLKDNVHAIQVRNQFCKGPHLDNECPLNKEVKQVDEVDYGEFGHPIPFNGSNGTKFYVGPPGTNEDVDDLEGIIDYLEPTLYDRFIDSDDEEYMERKCRLLGIPYIKPPLILIEKVNVTRYSFGPGEVYKKIKVSGVEELSRNRGNTTTIRAGIMKEIYRNDDKGESYDET